MLLDLKQSGPQIALQYELYSLNFHFMDVEIEPVVCVLYLSFNIPLLVINLLCHFIDKFCLIREQFR